MIVKQIFIQVSSIFLVLFIISCKPIPGPEDRLTYHRSVHGPAPQPMQETTVIPSILSTEAEEKIDNPEDWYMKRRPELEKLWIDILGKVEPSTEDEKWFGDITEVKAYSEEDMGDYIRIHLGIPIEIDFYQEHLLLIPKNPPVEPMPAVIAWAATSSSIWNPEEWWGTHLVKNGYVVLTSWSFIRNYRDSTDYHNGAHEKVYERFGHWLSLGKMVHDVRREAEYLQSLPQVDPDRIGFMGLSLSAKTAVYVGAFVAEIKVTVSIDPHIALNGSTNWFAPWYLDWKRKFPDIHTKDYPVPELRGTVQSLLDPDPETPGFERNHHELMALCAPRAFMIIGGNCNLEVHEGDSDDLQSWGYVNRAQEVYDLLGIPERFEFVTTSDGHAANGPNIDPAWQRFFDKWLKSEPIKFEGY